MPIWHHEDGPEFGNLHVEYTVVLPDEMDMMVNPEATYGRPQHKRNTSSILKSILSPSQSPTSLPDNSRNTPQNPYPAPPQPAPAAAPAAPAAEAPKAEAPAAEAPKAE